MNTRDCSILDPYRKYRIFGVSAIDTILTIIAAVIIAYAYSKYKHIDLKFKHVIITFLILLIIAIILHKLIGAPTQINAWLGLNTEREANARRVYCAVKDKLLNN